MDAAHRAAIVSELEAALGPACDVSPAADQPLHVLLERVNLTGSWTPNPARCLVVFTNWPNQRPDFYVDASVRSKTGEPPNSHSWPFMLGEKWLAYSWSFTWSEKTSPTRAVKKWLARFGKTE
jgi:hypothetical protein